MQTLSSAEKLIETMKERMNENSIDSEDQSFVVLKEIIHNLVMCSGSAVLLGYAQALRDLYPVWRWVKESTQCALLA